MLIYPLRTHVKKTGTTAFQICVRYTAVTTALKTISETPAAVATATAENDVRPFLGSTPRTAKHHTTRQKPDDAAKAGMWYGMAWHKAGCACRCGYIRV